MKSVYQISISPTDRGDTLRNEFNDNRLSGVQAVRAAMASPQTSSHYWTARVFGIAAQVPAPVPMAAPVKLYRITPVWSTQNARWPVEPAPGRA